jgi:hypothetical protein
MTQKIDLPVEELTRLYVDERMTLAAIAERFGTTQWTIGNRLRDAGVRKRPRGSRPLKFDPDELERLFRTGSPVTELAQRFGRSQWWISQLLKARGLATSNARPRRGKHPRIPPLAVGDHFDVPGERADRFRLYAAYQMKAKKAGIRVSVRTLDEHTMRVTRVGTAPRRNVGPNISVKEMIKLRRKGATLTEIARRAGITRTGVRYHLEKEGFTR